MNTRMMVSKRAKRPDAPWSRLLAVAALAAVSAAAGCKPAEPLDVILIVLDTTRRDHVSTYGYEKKTTPQFDALAETSSVYSRGYTTSSWTAPTHASMFTGVYPTDHGVQMLPDTLDHPLLSDEFVTLAEQFSEHGYATGGFIAAPTIDGFFGFGQGFDIYDDDFTDAAPDDGRPADEVAGNALDWLKKQEGPVFLFVNLFDAHRPLRPHEPCLTQFADGIPHGGPEGTFHLPLEQQLALYDAEICFADKHLGRLIDGLKETGRFDNAIIAVTSDHGDGYGDPREPSHGSTLLEPLIHVPLIVKRPGQKARTDVDEQFENRRFFHMLLEAADIPSPRPLLPTEVDREWVVAELVKPKGSIDGREHLHAIVEWPWKILERTDEETELYYLPDDPDERTNVAEANPEVLQRMEGYLETWLEERVISGGAAGPTAP